MKKSVYAGFNLIVRFFTLSALKSILVLLAFLWLFTASCDEEEEDVCFRCVYEERSTGCGGGSYGPWEEKEIFHNTGDIKSGLSKEDVCALIKSETHCASTCCVNYQVRNMKVMTCN